MQQPKFQFDKSFQLETIRFILLNSEGYEGLKYIRSSYYDLLEHGVIVESINRCVKRYGVIPSKPILREELRIMFTEARYYEAFPRKEQQEVYDIVEDLFREPSRDGGAILKNLADFASFVELRKAIEEADIYDFSSYSSFSSKVLRAIDLKNPNLEKEEGVFLIRDIKDRQFNRSIQDLVIPTPFNQVNKLTSAGGYAPGSIIVLLDQPKKLKTTFLINVARKYLASKKKVLYIDLENGEQELVSRLEQSIGRVTKKDIIKNIKDKEIQKVLRRYNRLGGEVYIKRLPALSTTRDIQAVMDRIYRTEGYQFNILIIDYIALMGSLSGKIDDFGRISDAYVDVSNLMLRNNISHCWTANHIQRQSYKRRATRYYGEDIAKCIDIVRHAHVIFGLNRNDLEEAHGIGRLEIVEQREGVPMGSAYFRINPETQRIDELTKKEMDELTEAGVIQDPNRLPDIDIGEYNIKGDI